MRAFRGAEQFIRDRSVARIKKPRFRRFLVPMRANTAQSWGLRPA
jgi:hypothetical protein